MTDELPDLGGELKNMADARADAWTAKVRHRNRIRAALQVARDAGLRRRHAAKLANNQTRKGKHEA